MKFEGSFKNKDAQNLIYRALIPDGTKISVILVHGLGEHSLKYNHLAESFYARGIAFFLYDQRGHGRSQGPICHIDRFDDILDDLKHFTEIVKAQTLQEEVYLLGLSLGALLSIIFSIRYGERIKGVIASAPPLRLKNPPSLIETAAAKALAVVAPSFTVSNKIPFKYISHDEAMIAETKADRFSHRVLSVRLFVEMTKAANYALENADKINAPILLIHGTDDKVVDVGGSKEFYERIGSKDKEIKLYDGLYHELLRETKRDEIAQDIITWILKRRQGCSDGS